MSIPDALLERYALGEVTEAERQQAEADPSVPERLRRLHLDDAAILRDHDPQHFAAQVHARRARRMPPSTGGPLVALALAAAVALIWVLPQAPGIRAKGSGAPALLLYLDAPLGPALVPPGAELRAGDVVQLAYLSGGHSHGVIVSVDGAGGVTLHHPRQGAGVLSEGEAVLPDAYRLDDAPRFERFFLVVDDAPVEVAPVLAAARALAVGDAPRTARLGVPQAQAELLVHKP